MRALDREADVEGAAYLPGGATAVLLGWRESTIAVDLVLVPESDRLLQALPRIKDALSVNVELVSPADFIPVPVGWEDRSPSRHERVGSPSITSIPTRRPSPRSSAPTLRMLSTSGP